MKHLLSVLITISFPVFALAQTNFEKCRSEFKTDIETQMQNLENRYQTITPNNYVINSDNKSFFLNAKSVSPKKSQKLAILIHGFMGSPYEMRDLGQRLQKKGFNVYGALIPGFGVNADIANKFRQEQWSRWVTTEINKASRCFTEIHMAGFSTGGLLIHDYLLKHSKNNIIKSAALVSPFFKVEGFLTSIISGSAPVVMDKISVNTVYHLLHFPDVEIMTLQREAYLQQVPVRTTEEIIELANLNREKIPASGSIKTPTLIFITEQDRVAEPTATEEVARRNLENSKIINYSKNRKRRIPHHILAHEISAVATDAENKIIEHFEQSWP